MKVFGSIKGMDMFAEASRVDNRIGTDVTDRSNMKTEHRPAHRVQVTEKDQKIQLKEHDYLSPNYELCKCHNRNTHRTFMPVCVDETS